MHRWSVIAWRVSVQSMRKTLGLILACSGIYIFTIAGQISTPKSINLSLSNLSQLSLLKSQSPSLKSQSSLAKSIGRRVEGHVALRLSTMGNTFVASEIRNGEEEKDNLLVLTFRLRSNSHTGVRLVSVRDPITGNSCTFTSDRRQIFQSDVVIIPGRAMHIQMPRYRAPHQRWVFYSSESFHSVEPHLKYQHSFNHTMTYHKHADIDTSKFGIVEHQSDQVVDEVTPTKSSDKLVVWMSSHCFTHSKREFFVKKLSKYVNVDIYGECGTLDCPKDGWCRQNLTQYKFYVAFENSICNGYISEKPWIGLGLNLVPLVAGGGSEAYKSVLPPNSYIDMERFNSPKEVAEYLKLLQSNDTLYQQYFKWKSAYGFGTFNIVDLSGRTCQYLHDTKNTGPHVVDLMEFADDRRAACHDWKNASWLQH